MSDAMLSGVAILIVPIRSASSIAWFVSASHAASLLLPNSRRSTPLLVALGRSMSFGAPVPTKRGLSVHRAPRAMMREQRTWG